MSQFSFSSGLAATLLLLLLAAGDPPAYPAGASTQELAGLKYRLVLPKPFDPKAPHSLLVALHGAGSNDAEIASWFEPLVPQGFILCAPKSTGPAWDRPDLDRVRKIVRHLLDSLPIGEGRLHAAGFSNGGMNLPAVAFDPDLPFITVCFMGSGFGGGTVPKSARERIGVLALVGSEDPFAPVARQTPERLKGKVKDVEVREQAGLAHEIPADLMPYYYSWILAREGRFEPGEDGSFDWWRNPEEAKKEMAKRKVGGLVWFFDAEQDRGDDAKHLQTVVFFDPAVRKAMEGRVAIQCHRFLEEELFGKLGLTKTPALVVLSPTFEVTAKWEGRVEVADLLKALRRPAD